jgi:hypothetical protein
MLQSPGLGIAQSAHKDERPVFRAFRYASNAVRYFWLARISFSAPPALNHSICGALYVWFT